MSRAEFEAAREAARIQRQIIDKRELDDALRRIAAVESIVQNFPVQMAEMQRRLNEYARILDPSLAGECQPPPRIGLRPGERPHA